MALPVITKGTVIPPGAPADKDAYLIYGVGAVGSPWEGWQGSVAQWWAQGGIWQRFELSSGNIVICLDDLTSWFQEDAATPPTWTQLTSAVGELTQIQLGISGTVAIPIGVQPGWIRSHGIGTPLTWELIVDPPGTVTVDIYVQPYPAAPPVFGSMVGAGVPPAVIAAARATGDTSTWTGITLITPGDYLRLDVLGVAVSQALTLNLMM